MYDIAFFLLMVLGLWIVCWAMWGGSIKIENRVPANEAGLGLNP